MNSIRCSTARALRRPVRRGLARCLVLVAAIVAGLLATSAPTPAEAAPPIAARTSPDGTARVVWTHDVVSGRVNWTLSDLVRDGKCVTATSQVFGQVLGFSSPGVSLQACDNRAEGGYTDWLRRQTIWVKVCGADGRCTVTKPDTGCSDDYPTRLRVIPGPGEEEYVDEVIACTDHAWSKTMLVNKSDVVWKISDRSGRAPMVWDIDTIESSIFRSVRPDSGLPSPVPLLPLLLEGTTTIVNLRPADVVWKIDYLLSASWVGTDAMIGEVKSVVTSAVLKGITRGTPKWGAFATCALAGWNTAKFVPGIDGTDLGTAIIDGVPIVGQGVSCARAIATAFSDAQWPRGGAVAAIDNLVTGVGWLDRFSVMDELTEFLARALFVLP